MTTRFNYRNTLIKEFFARYNKDERHELYNLIKVYKLYSNVDSDLNIDETIEYQDIVNRSFWDNNVILDRLLYLKNLIKLYDENVYDSNTHTGNLAYECEYKLDVKLRTLHTDIERWLVHNIFDDDVYYCPSCDEVRDSDDYNSDYDCCEACADSRREEEEYNDDYEDEDYAYEHERYCYNYTYPVHENLNVRYREDETIDDNLHTSKDLLYGVELEVMARNSMPDDYPDTLHDYNGDWFKCKKDGSLDEGNGGFEICTAPSTFKFLKDRFTQMFNSDYWTDENGSTYVKGWNTTCAGLHIHINKKALTPLEVGKLLVFVNDKKNARFIEDIAGRNMNRWCKSETKKISDGQYRSDDRYEAVNTVPSKTVELRIFKSNVSEHGFMRALEFTDGMIRYLKQSSMREQSLSYKSFISFIKKPENRSEYPNFWSWLITNGYVLGTPSRNVSRQFENVSNG
jgi:hypothetical protein